MIIGLVGKKYSGKTTIANYLVTHYDFIEYSIASPLKEIAKILYKNFSFLHYVPELNLESCYFTPKIQTELIYYLAYLLQEFLNFDSLDDLIKNLADIICDEKINQNIFLFILLFFDTFFFTTEIMERLFFI